MSHEIDLSITDREGNTHNIQAPTDMNMNLMEVIRAFELAPEGTIGVCCGMAMCASCQCYILSENVPLAKMNDEEEAMLSEAFYVEDNSRLSCQIPVTEILNGLEIELAPES